MGFSKVVKIQYNQIESTNLELIIISLRDSTKTYDKYIHGVSLKFISIWQVATIA